MPATRRLVLIIIVLFFLLLFFVVPSVSWSQTPPSPWQESAREFSKKIAALTGTRQTVTLTVRNISSLSETEAAAVRAALETELRAAGLRLAAKTSTAPELRITLSENLQGLLWIADFLREDSRDVTMFPLPKSTVSAPTAITQMYVLQSKLVVEQDEPILDFTILEPASVGTGARLLVLEPARLALYQSENGRWNPRQFLSLPPSSRPSRDPRGNILIKDDGVVVVFAGMICVGAIRPAMNLQCSASERGRPEAWQNSNYSIGSEIVPGKNYFRMKWPVDGERAERELQFVSSAVIPRGETALLILANLDGTVSVYATPTSSAPMATITGWGSELAEMRTACGRGTQLLGTRNGDWTEPDTVQAFEYHDGQVIAVSSPIVLPGPVVELLSGVAPQSAGAVVRNLKTGRYEAYTLTLSCGR